MLLSTNFYFEIVISQLFVNLINDSALYIISNGVNMASLVEVAVLKTGQSAVKQA